MTLNKGINKFYKQGTGNHLVMLFVTDVLIGWSFADWFAHYSLAKIQFRHENSTSQPVLWCKNIYQARGIFVLYVRQSDDISWTLRLAKHYTHSVL